MINIIDFIRQRLVNQNYCPNTSVFRHVTEFVSATSYTIDAGNDMYFLTEIESTEKFLIESDSDMLASDNYFLANKKTGLIKEFSGSILITKESESLQAFSFIVVTPKRVEV